jgi:hypothetical protein
MAASVNFCMGEIMNTYKICMIFLYVKNYKYGGIAT